MNEAEILRNLIDSINDVNSELRGLSVDQVIRRAGLYGGGDALAAVAVLLLAMEKRLQEAE